MTRSSTDEAEAENAVMKRARSCLSQPLLDYHFLMPLVLGYLNDADVLKRLVLTGKVVKPALINYAVKSALTPEEAFDVVAWHRYLPVRVLSLATVEDEQLHVFTSLETIRFYDDFDGPIRPGMIPLSVMSIELGVCYNHIIGPNVLPPGLEYLNLGMDFDHPLAPGVLPDSITHLDLSSAFDQPLTAGVLPQSLQELRFPFDYTHKIMCGVLPQSLRRLSFSSFDKPFETGSLPASIRFLQFLHDFDQDLDESIMPSSLISLELSSQFASRLFLPSGLISLTLKSSLSHIEFINPFPSSLTALMMIGSPTEDVIAPGVLPNTLVHLFLTQPVVVGSIPDSVVDLKYSSEAEILPNVIPTSVKSLLLSKYNHILWPGVVPSSVTQLKLCGFDQPLLPGSLPNSITHLDIGREFDQLLTPGVLPERLLSLSLDRHGGRFNKPLFALPTPCCQHRCESHQSDLIHSLPRSITHLCLSEMFNQPLRSDSLPPHLTHLAMGEGFTQPLSDQVLPASLKELVVGSRYNVDLTHVHCKIQRLSPFQDVEWMPKFTLSPLPTF